MSDIFGAVVVIATFVLIIRGAEVRLALLCAGAVLAIAAGKPNDWFDAFAASMTQAGLITVILPAVGFTAVIRMGECDKHLIRALVRPMRRLHHVIVPAAMLVTVLVAIALSSAAAVTAAVGVVMIPALIALGVHPAMAAAALIGGTWAAAFSPASPHPALIGDMAKIPVMEVIVAHLHASIPALIVYLALLYGVGRVLGEDRGWAGPGSGEAEDALQEAVNPFKALMPVLPLLLLILGLPQFGIVTGFLPKGVTVLQAMVVGTVATALVARLSPGRVSRAFFDGMGESYAGVMGIIIAAGVFIAGLTTLGVVDDIINALKQAQSIAPIAGMVGPFGIAVLSGSGDAAAIAFNKAMLPHAEALGMTKVALGNIAWIGSALGRGMSPVAAATAIAAGYAGVPVFEIAKRTAIPALVSAVVVVVLMSFSQ